ncbi:hypothetical protein KA405_05935 [Patescibacteria group bacterium]|nr:hypothetical protein [Patescibacteria group bacterium]
MGENGGEKIFDTNHSEYSDKEKENLKANLDKETKESLVSERNEIVRQLNKGNRDVLSKEPLLTKVSILKQGEYKAVTKADMYESAVNQKFGS